MLSISLGVAFLALGRRVRADDDDDAYAAYYRAEDISYGFEHDVLIVCGAAVGAVIVWNLVAHVYKSLRLMATVNDDRQSIFRRPSHILASLKKHLLYAPIFKLRHSNPIMLTRSFRIGAVPTRLQSLFIVAYVAANLAFCFARIDYSDEYASGTVRDRAGDICVANMIPLFILAARNNPLIKWAGIPFDTYNLLHRWVGRVVIVEAIIHVAAYVIGMLQGGYASYMREDMAKDPFYIYGMLAFVAFIIILVQASSASRLKAYEFFKYLHIVCAIAGIIGLWYHLTLYEYPEIKYVYGLIAIWCAERCTRGILTLYRSAGNGGGTALIEALPDSCVRVTVSVARPWLLKPGQHVYLYLPKIGFITSHPFSIAWAEDTAQLDSEGSLAADCKDMLAMRRPKVTFLSRGCTGLTKKLVALAEKADQGAFETWCLVEGPYGGLHMMDSYGTVILVGGGVGITHQLLHARALLTGMAEGSVATRKIVLIWAIHRTDHFEWARKWIESLLSVAPDETCFRVVVFVSQPRSAKDSESSYPAMQIFPGRANMGVLLDQEIATRVGAMSVSVCGPGSLSDDVRKAVRERQTLASIDFEEESFSW